MKNGMIAERVQKLLAGLRCEFLADVGRTPTKMGRLDSAVLKVAMMVSALDGFVTDKELKAFERIAKECRGYSAEDAKRVFREGLKVAGYVELAARTFSQKDLIGLFVEEAEAALPGGFVFGNARDVRRAFVMWTAMAMSDGDYSDIERKAIRSFAEVISLRVETARRSSAALQRGFAPAFAMAYANDRGLLEGTVLSPEFFRRAEEAISGLGQEATSLTSAKKLKQLILDGAVES